MPEVYTVILEKMKISLICNLKESHFYSLGKEKTIKRGC